MEDVIRQHRSPVLSRVVVEPHNSEWAEKFSRESQQVSIALNSTVELIHHIGSTAIPIIYAKPVIDMLVEVSSIKRVDLQAMSMASVGYEVMGQYGIPGRRYFRKDSESGQREFQVHVFEAGSTEIVRHLAFRDYLLAHPQVAHEYSALKRSLVTRFPDDAEAYMDGKDFFITTIVGKALSCLQR